MKIAKFLTDSILTPIVFLTSVAFVEAATIHSSKSSVVVTFKQEGVAVPANFKNVSGTIDFDAANPANSKAQIAVALTSFDLGEPEYNKEVQKKEWFNSAQFPQATFVSSDIKSAGAGKLVAQGKLTIKGKALDVSVPIAFKQEGKTQVFEGQLPIKRLFFNIGEGEWKDTDILADEVVIKFKVVTNQ
ncbi:MAG: YceI family protein [Spongiibacteraceae bacterium]